MKEFILILAMGFALGAVLILSLCHRDNARIQMQFGEAIMAIQMGK
jgi:hypothetical protein